MRDLFARALARPEALALVTPEERLTWRELSARALAIDRALAVAGVGAGEGVALWLPNGAAWLVGFWGAMLGGRTVVPLSTFSPPGDVVRLLRHAGARALLTTAGFAHIEVRALWPQRAELPALRLVVVAAAGDSELPAGVKRWEELPPAAGSGPTGGDAGGDWIAVIQYTSGTTAAPKGALLRASGLARSARTHAADWRLAAGDPLFVPNPFSHILGLTYGVLTVAAAGGTTLTQASFDLDQALDLLVHERAVAMTGAPTHLQMLADHPQLATCDLSALRLAMTGGAPLGLDWARRIRRRLGLASLVNGYGMSEVGSVAQTGLDDPPEVVASAVGNPMPGLEVRLVDPTSEEDVAAGEVGELWLRGLSVMAGYHRERELTARAFTVDGWLRTGDLLRRSSAGNLCFVGRRVDVITVGGFDVVAGDVERVLLAHPAIAEAQVVGAADERLGAVPVAFLCAAEKAAPDLATVTAHCREHLRRYMVPRRLVVLEAMPRGATGKVDRRELSRRAAALLGAAR